MNYYLQTCNIQQSSKVTYYSEFLTLLAMVDFYREECAASPLANGFLSQTRELIEQNRKKVSFYYNVAHLIMTYKSLFHLVSGIQGK
jgi:hypothetical protein